MLADSAKIFDKCLEKESRNALSSGRCPFALWRTDTSDLHTWGIHAPDSIPVSASRSQFQNLNLNFSAAVARLSDRKLRSTTDRARVRPGVHSTASTQSQPSAGFCVGLSSFGSNAMQRGKTAARCSSALRVSVSSFEGRCCTTRCCFFFCSAVFFKTPPTFLKIRAASNPNYKRVLATVAAVATAATPEHSISVPGTS